VIPFPILRKLILETIQDKEATVSALQIIYGRVSAAEQRA
jgi:hypothetical protein